MGMDGIRWHWMRWGDDIGWPGMIEDEKEGHEMI